MRAGIVGGGLAGALLAWRLAQAAPGWRVDLFAARPPGLDATSASGGAVRAFETGAEQRRLALDSMVELLHSPVLREWAGYRPVDAVYLSREPTTVHTAASEIEARLPGSVDLPGPDELAAAGWARLDGDEVAIRERRAGAISPARLRAAAIADVRHRVTVRTEAVDAVTARPDGLIACAVADRSHEYDAVVVAAGAWTAGLLGRSGLPAPEYRTKSIQYTVYPTGDWQPPQFVDEVTGVYGLPQADSGLLLGVPTQEWDVDPDHPPLTPALQAGAAEKVRTRFPALRLGPARRRVGSADCYGDRPVLALRGIGRGDHLLYTFSGGAGGSAKTALAASELAATRLLELARPAGSDVTGQAVNANPSSNREVETQP